MRRKAFSPIGLLICLATAACAQPALRNDARLGEPVGGQPFATSPALFGPGFGEDRVRGPGPGLDAGGFPGRGPLAPNPTPG